MIFFKTGLHAESNVTFSAVIGRLAADAAGMLFFSRVGSSLCRRFFFDSSGASRVFLKWRPVKRVGSLEAE